jgi:hypothetical protein
MKKTRKIFDAVEESRHWRAQTSQVLDAMTCAERITYLATLCSGSAKPESAPTPQEIPLTPLAVHDDPP